MRKQLLFLVFLLVCSSTSLLAADEPPVIQDQLDKINYSYGYQMGRELLATGVDFKPELLWQALNEGLQNAKPHMQKDEMAYFLELLREEAK